MIATSLMAAGRTASIREKLSLAVYEASSLSANVSVSDRDMGDHAFSELEAPFDRAEYRNHGLSWLRLFLAGKVREHEYQISYHT